MGHRVDSFGFEGGKLHGSEEGHCGFDDRRCTGFVDRGSQDSGVRRSPGCGVRRTVVQSEWRTIRPTRRSLGSRRGPLSGERHSSSGRSVGHWDRRQADPGDHKPLGSGRLVGRKL